MRVDVTLNGVKGDGTNEQVAIQGLATQVKEGSLYFPGRSYLFDELVTNPGVGVEGDGWSSVLQSSNDSWDVLTASGRVLDVCIRGAKPNPQTFQAALKLKGIAQAEVRGVLAINTRIGFDLVGNCYGSSFFNCRNDPPTVSMPVFLRPGWESGNDIQFYSCRFQGRDGAVCATKNGGGYRFFAGLLSGGVGQTAARPDLAVLNLGYDYIAGGADGGGVGGVFLDAVSFEQFRYMYGVRIAAGTTLQSNQSSFQANNGIPIAVALYDKNASGSVEWHQTTVSGSYSSATPWDATDNPQDGLSIIETGTQNIGLFNGKQLSRWSMAQASGTALRNATLALGRDPVQGPVIRGGQFGWN